MPTAMKPFAGDDERLVHHTEPVIEPPGPRDDQQVIRAKLRDLVWRVDQVRSQLTAPSRAMDDRTLAQFLETADAHEALKETSDHGER